MDGKIKLDGETLNPENNILDKWKLETPTGGIQSTGVNQ